jgi:hypothetical protein
VKNERPITPCGKRPSTPGDWSPLPGASRTRLSHCPTHHGQRRGRRRTYSKPSFCALIKGQEDYDLSRNPEAYLSRAAINASLDLLRSRTRSKVVALDDVNTDTLASGFRNPEMAHADQELQTLIRAAVARLGKTAGEMFVLRYYEGF